MVAIATIRPNDLTRRGLAPSAGSSPQPRGRRRPHRSAPPRRRRRGNGPRCGPGSSRRARRARGVGRSRAASPARAGRKRDRRCRVTGRKRRGHRHHDLSRLGRSLSGAVLTANADPKKQLPLPNVEITAEAGGTTVRTKSDASGFFQMKWRPAVWPGEQVTFRFRHPNHQPLEITRPLNDELYIARMTSSPAVKDLESHGEEVAVGDIRVRYAVKTTTTINIGSSAKIFEVANTGNIPCAGRPPCSPDGKWKAASSSLALDAGEGQEFQNVRVSCIAGPCPFTKIDSDSFSNGGRKIRRHGSRVVRHRDVSGGSRGSAHHAHRLDPPGIPVDFRPRHVLHAARHRVRGQALKRRSTDCRSSFRWAPISSSPGPPVRSPLRIVPGSTAAN